MAQLWPHFVSYWDFKSTRGSPDIIHFIFYASQVLWWILEVNTVLEAKENFLSDYKYFGGFSLFEGGRQPFFHKIIMFLCLLERKFPELFKTHPTFFPSALQKAKKSNNAKFTLLSGPPCSSLKNAQRKYWGIYYQMDHIWWASSRLKNSARLKMRSQLNHTLYH